MKYNVDYWLKFFGKKRDWVRGTLGMKGGSHCALGHMGFQMEENADKSKRAIALGDMIKQHIEKKYELKMMGHEGLPSNLIPWINDVGDGVLQFRQKTITLPGNGPQERFMNLCKEIKQECLKNNGVKSKNRAEAVS